MNYDGIKIYVEQRGGCMTDSDTSTEWVMWILLVSLQHNDNMSMCATKNLITFAV